MFFHFPFKPLTETYMKVIIFLLLVTAELKQNIIIKFTFYLKKMSGKVKSINHKEISLKIHKMSGIQEIPKYFIFQFVWPLILSVTHITKSVEIYNDEHKVFCIQKHGHCCIKVALHHLQEKHLRKHYLQVKSPHDKMVNVPGTSFLIRAEIPSLGTYCLDQDTCLSPNSGEYIHERKSVMR